MAGRPLRPRALSSTGISSSSAARRRPGRLASGGRSSAVTDGVALVLGQRPLAAGCPRDVGDVRCGWPRDVEPGRRVRCGWPCDVELGGRVPVESGAGTSRACISWVEPVHVGPAGRRAVRHRRLGARSPAVLRGMPGAGLAAIRRRGIVRDAGRRGPPRDRPLPSWRRWRVRCAPAAGAQRWRDAVAGIRPRTAAVAGRREARREDLPGPARRRTRAVRGSRTDRSRPSRWSCARRPPGTVAGPPPAARGSGTPLRSAARTPADPDSFCAGRGPGRAAGRPCPSAASRHAEWSVVPVLRAIPEALRRRAGAGAGQVVRAVPDPAAGGGPGASSKPCRTRNSSDDSTRGGRGRTGGRWTRY